MDLAIKTNIIDKCRERDEQANIILQILELAKKLNYCNYELSEKVRFTEYLSEIDVEELRRALDVSFWRQTLIEYQVEKFLTSTDREKFFEKLEGESPIFNEQNVNDMVLKFMGSREATATNMIKKVYKEVSNAIFCRGGRGNAERRLQKCIKNNFRLSIFYVYGGELPSYVSDDRSNFVLVSDLERALYLLDNKLQPDFQNGISSKTTEVLQKGGNFVDSEYMEIRLYKNGNVKIKIKRDDLLEKFNRWGRAENTLE